MSIIGGKTIQRKVHEIMEESKKQQAEAKSAKEIETENQVEKVVYPISNENEKEQ